MKIVFNELKETPIPEFNGGMGTTILRMFDDKKVKILFGRLEPNASVGLHSHMTSCEVIFVLSGEGMVLCDGEMEPVGPGDCHYCPKGHSHSLINKGIEELIFWAVVPEQR